MYNLVQRFKTQDMVTRSELVEIIARQRESKQLLEDADNSQQFMDYCIDSMRETYNSSSSSCLKQSNASSTIIANTLIDKRLDRSKSLTGSFSGATADFQNCVGQASARIDKPEVKAMAISQLHSAGAAVGLGESISNSMNPGRKSDLQM